MTTTSRCTSWCPSRRALLISAALLAAGLSCADPAPAQLVRGRPGQRSIPTPAYFAAFNLYYEGDYGRALDVYESEGRGAIKSTVSRWIDSICYFTMTGECYYQMGHHARALEHYTAALKLYNGFSDWMLRVSFPARVRPEVNLARKTIPWNRIRSPRTIGQYPDTMLISQGELDVNAQVRRGGAIQQAIKIPMNVTEVARCTALAMRRRTELLGPLGKYDPLAAQLVGRLEARPSPPNNWSTAWINVQLGLAYAAVGRPADAVKWLEQGLLAEQQFDHPLTPIALLELGKLHMRVGDHASLIRAAKLFEQAAYSAYAFEQYDVIEEAFYHAHQTRMMGRAKGVYATLMPAAAWARTHSRQLQASLVLSAVESYAVAGETTAAAKILHTDAIRAIGRRLKSSMGMGNIGARLDYVTALVNFQQGNLEAGDEALASLMTFQRHGSLRMLQINLADAAIESRQVRLRQAMELYEEVLRDPTPLDWSISPIEALSTLATPHPLPYERWFLLAMSRKDFDTAQEIADLARRQRFHGSLPMGGRMLSLRWILEDDSQVRGPAADQQRRDLLQRYPRYAELARQTAGVRARLDVIPLVAEGDAQRRDQATLLAQLADLGAKQEVALREIAVRREASELVFPPRRTTKEIRAALPKGRALWTFYVAGDRLYSFMSTAEKSVSWSIADAATLRKSISDLLRKMNHYDGNYMLTREQLADDAWRGASAQLLNRLLLGSKVPAKALGDSFDELVIVPDGLLWYLPLEALHLPAGAATAPLLTRTRVHYAPTASLAVPFGGPQRRSPATAVVAGRLHPRDDERMASREIARLQQAVKQTVALASPLPAPSPVYRIQMDQLLVMDDIDLAGKGPYGWSPVQIGRDKAVAPLSRWFSLPWGGPRTVLLPGYHTAAEDSLKPAAGTPPDGHEVFLTVCGMMSTGTRTILLSRWRNGGQTSYDLVREFTQELPFTTASVAWQRSVALARETPLREPLEPRLKPGAAAGGLTAAHPFFWSGYMLIDAAAPPADEAVAGE